jgi:hypothetical protein
VKDEAHSLGDVNDDRRSRVDVRQPLDQPSFKELADIAVRVGRKCRGELVIDHRLAGQLEAACLSRPELERAERIREWYPRGLAACGG